VFVALALLCLLGVLLFKAIEVAEARYLVWHASQRGLPDMAGASA
jgi:NitT/TauT family transport system permease protein